MERITASEMEPLPSHEVARAYQLEMLDHSLRRNVIVAMDTGSGKTRVSILRMRAQLETSSGKLIWFLAPTVLLCAQQYNAITAEIPSIAAKLVTGHEDVDTWDASTWKTILSGIQAIISTYQVLLDALDHAFVDFSNLSLLIFDEAHNCVGNSPGGKIMSQFYHFEKTRGGRTPAILGLTATPSIRADAKGLEALEILLDARCISPTIHRQQLLQCTNYPRLLALHYRPCFDPAGTPSLDSLKQVCSRMDIMQDPFIISLRAQNTDSSHRTLLSLVKSQKTWSSLQLKGFMRRACEVLHQLGHWALDLYIFQVKAKFLQSLAATEKPGYTCIAEEKVYVAGILRNIDVAKPTQSPMELDSMSDKVQLLLRELLTFRDNPIGIIFVKERATAYMLTKLLQSLTKLRDRFQFGCLVGTSNHQRRNRCLYEFPDSADSDILSDFRSQKINILVATSVLEEGIDVPACNLVICFDGPPTSRSFIQRRGRARMQKSDLILLLESDQPEIKQWISLESEIAKLCQDTQRKQKEREALEGTVEELSLIFRVPATGARLDQDNATAHLYHFCQKVAPGEFIDQRPEFITEVIGHGLKCRVKAEVRLPTCLPTSTRKFLSANAWVSEKNAMKDAAFQAVVGLYYAGLVNGHLLPYETTEVPGVEAGSSIVTVDPVYQPWHDIAVAWNESQTHWSYTMRLQGPNPTLFAEYSLTLPVFLRPLPPVLVYLDHETAYQVCFSTAEAISRAESQTRPDNTSVLLALHFAHRWDLKNASHVIKISSDGSLAMEGINARPIDPACIGTAGQQYLIRDSYLSPGMYIETLRSKPPIDLVRRPFKNYQEAPEEQYVHLSKWTRRTDFLHRPHVNMNGKGQIPSAKPYSCVVPMSCAREDTIDVKHARFGMLLPSIIHHVETMLIARKLSQTLLQPLEISNLTLLLEAVTSGGANRSVSYERLEFIGDSILKFCASVQAAATHLHWPEGYLSSYKDRLVANARLSRAAIETGLSRFILSAPFTGQKWRPFYNVDFLSGEDSNIPARQLSTKILADVVEALIAVCYMAGGMPKVIRLLTLFIRDCSWMDPTDARNSLFQQASLSMTSCAYLEPLEDLIRYSFEKKSLLLEAVTHGSYLVDTKQRSQGRLEFLGDAILDAIVVTKLFDHVPSLPHHTMHMIKTAMVNKDFLAFLSLEEHECSLPEESQGHGIKHRRLAMWQFLRHASNGLSGAQSETRKRHQDDREDILRAIHHGGVYPWALLVRLQANKFFSDLFESILGAIWVDSGSMAQCEAFLAHFGLMPYLMRIFHDGVHVQHPKEELTKLACTEKVIYNVEPVLTQGSETHLRCTISFGDRQVVEVEGGFSMEEVKTKAATAAVALLKR